MGRRLVFWVTILWLGGFGAACAAPTPLAALPALLPIGREVLKDEFKTNALGWDTYQGQEGLTGIENEQYHILVRAPFAEIWANPDAKYAIPNDVIIEVQAHSSASPDNYFGILCRYQNRDNYYFLVVSSDGYYGIGKVKNGQHGLINRVEMPPSDLISGDFLRLRAECTADRLALFVNGAFLDEQTDPDFAQGGVGLIAGSYQEEVNIYFDNFMVFEAQR